MEVDLRWWVVSKPELESSQSGKNRFYSGRFNREKRPQHRTGLRSQDSMGKWGFIAKKQVLGHRKLLRGNISVRGILVWLDCPNWVLAEYRPGTSGQDDHGEGGG